MFFASDNGSGVPRPVMEALVRANHGPARAYGADPLTGLLRERIRTVFEAPEAEIALVATGTAANALSLALACPPWGAVYCHETAHVEADECGAPEFFTGGAKLVLLPGADGRIDPAALEARLAGASRSVHSVQPGVLSLTNATEAGTVYTPGGIATLAALARSHGLPCHLDGARLANALAACGCTPAEMTWKAGIDILSLGGTKNGLLAAEAVVILDPARIGSGGLRELELRRKRAGHLVSKHRYLAAQMLAWLEDGLWLSLARDANALAQRLSRSLAALPGVAIAHPVEANIVFARLPEAMHARAEAAGAVYYRWPDRAGEAPGLARFVCSWSSTMPEVDALLAAFRG